MPTLTTIRPGVTFTPPAAASFRRLEHRLGRRIDVNSTYRDWDKQLRMHLAWLAWVNGTGPKPPHSRAVHPSKSDHCLAIGLDSDDWRTPGFIALAAEYGFIRTAANDPTERHHFQYQSWRDQHRNEPIPTPKPKPKPKPKPIEPAPTPEEEEDDMDYRPTVHARLAKDNKTEDEWMLAHPGIGADLPVFEGVVTATNARTSTDKTVKTFRGFMVTTDRATMTAWARTYAKGVGNITSSTKRDDYVRIQREASRISGELAVAVGIVEVGG